LASWYEGAHGQCRREIFGEIFKLVSGGVVGADLDFPTHDAKQAFASVIEHAGAGIFTAATSLITVERVGFTLSVQCEPL
jgi:hypothetical protein